MFNKAKYIVIDTGLNDEMIIFSFTLNHNDVARNFDGKVISAGFIQFSSENDEVVASCYGESVSLGIKSKPETDNIIAAQLLGTRWW